jgi:hypothetical protein
MRCGVANLRAQRRPGRPSVNPADAAPARQRLENSWFQRAEFARTKFVDGRF